MKTITRKINLYTYEELSKEAKEKALRDHRETNEYYFLSDYLNERLHELLEENKIKDINGEYDTVNQVRPKGKARVLYSLSHCQGDGTMFEGNFKWDKYIIDIKHDARYYHSNSKIIEIHGTDDSEYRNKKEYKDLYEEFEVIYQSICKQLEKYGYDFIEYEDSEEAFMEACEANGFTFLSTGVMENE